MGCSVGTVETEASNKQTGQIWSWQQTISELCCRSRSDRKLCLLACKNFGRMFDHSFPACTFFFWVGVGGWSLACTHKVHSLCQDQSTMAQQADATEAKCSLTSYKWVCFWIGSHTMPGQRHSQPIPNLLGQGCMDILVQPATCTFGRTTRVFYISACHCSNTGVEHTLNKSQHTWWSLETKILSLYVAGFELATF